MDTLKIKILRNTISIPLNKAIDLLKKNNGDIAASIENFHDCNIKEISRVAECNEDTARESYNMCHYDKTKAIEKINLKQVIITTRENPTPRNEIGYIIWPMSKERENYKTTKRNDAFIPAEDFDFILNEFKSVFPHENPWNKIQEKSFDIRGHNFFDNKTCRIIINNISQLETDTPKVEKFKKEVLNWFNEKLIYADYIVVYGNL